MLQVLKAEADGASRAMGPACVVVSGYDRAGKSTFSDVASRMLNVPVREMGDYVRAWQRRDPHLSRDTSAAHQTIRGLIGVRGMVCNLSANIQEPFVLCGVRDRQAIQITDGMFSSTYWIWIDASFETRSRRPQRDGPPLAERDAVHDRWGIRDIKKRADLTIRNDTTYSSFVRECRRVIHQLDQLAGL